MNMIAKNYEVIVIGGGPAGLTTSLYTARSRFSTLLLEQALCGGQMTTTDVIENYPGFPEGIEGSVLSRLMEEQAKRFGVETATEEVLEVRLEEDKKIVRTYDSTYRCDALILCMGAEYRKLGVPGEKEFIGRGVSFCSTCDAAFFKDCRIFVVGGGDSALSEAIYLTKFASEVTIIHRRDVLRGTKIYQERASANPKIKFLWNSLIQEIRGKETVSSALIRNVKTNQITDVETDGIFIFVGLVPRTRFVEGLVKIDEAGYIIADENCETSVRGIFAAGDCRRQLLRQIATAVGGGATAAFAVEKYFEEKK